MKRRKKFAFELALIVVAVAVGVGFSLKPWQALGDQRRARDQRAKDMASAEKRSEELVRQKAAVDSQLGREALARRNHYTRPGETPIEGD